MNRIVLVTAIALGLGSAATAAASAKTVEFKVGQTKHITAYRGSNCSAGAPSFAQVLRQIPKSSLVTYSDGGLSSRVSDQCGKRVPTRAVNGKAVKKGSETKRYQSGTVKLVVK